ncbi:hypothetical protein PR202_ga22749 [Eleusine coracana subsp. coracana]|uniref:Uncharacterized protein n=1 Tax=Eleusine coracana subsp. coracana TaxID=191504 RepID=A0AAV5D2I2_ELECO|nr:hypothetical protein PR202_ga22749 [Eleusine coracana subsp. coracana]
MEVAHWESVAPQLCVGSTGYEQSIQGWGHAVEDDIVSVLPDVPAAEVNERIIVCSSNSGWALQFQGAKTHMPNDNVDEGYYAVGNDVTELSQIHCRTFAIELIIIMPISDINECELRKSNPAKYGKLYPCHSA